MYKMSSVLSEWDKLIMYINVHVLCIIQDMININDITPLFAKGHHHPTMLTILQALLILIGEVRMYVHTCIISLSHNVSTYVCKYTLHKKK